MSKKNLHIRGRINVPFFSVQEQFILTKSNPKFFFCSSEAVAGGVVDVSGVPKAVGSDTEVVEYVNKVIHNNREKTLIAPHNRHEEVKEVELKDLPLILLWLD